MYISILLHLIKTHKLFFHFFMNIAAAFQGMHVSPANHSDTE